MREWNLKTGDPLELTLAADARLGPTSYCDDQIWELKIGGGDPPALALQTTYGLRARSMRLFPRFSEGDLSVTDPGEFLSPPVVRQFFSNYLRLHCKPLTDLDVELEYWVPGSQAVSGRITLRNLNKLPRLIQLSLIAQLNASEGKRMAPRELQSAPLLAGETAELAPVVFLTGGPQAVSSPYSALNLEVELPSGGTRRFTWSHAALSDVEASFNLARLTAARPWDAEIANLEMVNSAQVEVYTGDPDWDAAFAFSQKLANAAWIGATDHLPFPSIVLSRLPDQGYSLRGDGSDYNPMWNGQTPLEVYYLANLSLPGAADRLQGLIYNFIAAQEEDGSLDWKPGLAGQRSHLLAMPILATLSRRIFQFSQDRVFLGIVFQPLLDFVQAWFTERHDRDGDGFPEWDHPMQIGFEDHPIFSRWQEWAQGVDISTAESPSLGAMLLRECESLIWMAKIVRRDDAIPALQSLVDRLRIALESTWDENSQSYVYLDRDSHFNSQGEKLGERTGPGEIVLQSVYQPPVRLFVQIKTAAETTIHPELVLYGESATGQSRVERITQEQFRWFGGKGTLTGERVFGRLERVSVQGLGADDRVEICSVGFAHPDLTLLLPLWAGVPDPKRARLLVKKTITAARRYWRPFGMPACPVRQKEAANLVCSTAYLPWNLMIAEGLLAYGYREQAATLVSRIMRGIIENLKRGNTFYRLYQVDSGEGVGDRNALVGLAPTGVFLETLGVRIYTANRVFLAGFNPFPWPVTVKYRGLTVLRRKDSTVITFPDGQTTTIADPSPQIVSLQRADSELVEQTHEGR